MGCHLFHHPLAQSMDHEQEANDPWISVPDDLVVKIIARLPLPSLLRLRSLNTRFLHITSSNACLHRWAHLRALNPWLLFWIWKNASGLTHKAQCLIHDGVSEFWHELPVDVLPVSFGSCILGSAGGLVLLCNNATPSFKYVKKLLIVCNVLTKSWIQVPKSSNIVSMEATGFIVDEKTKSYKIVVVGAAREGEAGHNFFAMSTSRRKLVTEVYDSEGKAWRAGGAFPEGLGLHMNAMISCDKRLYCWSDKTVSVVAYSVEKDVWETIAMPDSQDADRQSWLVRCAGMPMIVGSMKREGAGMTIWKLMEELGNEWMEVEAMPVEQPENFCDANGGCCIRQCVGVGGRIYILSSTTDVPSIVFDYPARSWSVLPRLPSEELWGHFSKRTHVEATELQPSFLASP